MITFIITITSFLASILTLYSGFGLGTILMPVVAVFFPVTVAEATASVCRDNAGNLDLNIVIEEVETKMARNIGRGEGLASTLECRYGLNPAAGSYR